MKNFSLQFSTSFYRLMSISIYVLLSAPGLMGQYDLVNQQMILQGSNDQTKAISDDGQGNTYLAGYFSNTITLGTFTLTTTGGITAFIGKYNSNSNTWLWAKKIALVQGSFKQSQILDMTLDNVGNIYFTGEYAGTIAFDNILLTSGKQGSNSTNDIFVAKLNSSGVFTWAKSLGSKTGWDSGKSIVLDGANNIYIGGFITKRVANCGTSPTEQRDVYLAKLNNAGSAIWQKQYSSNVPPCDCTECISTNNSAYDVAIDGSGNVFLTGAYYATISFGKDPGLSITSVNGTDAFAAKINGSGITQWVKSTGGTSLDKGLAIYTDAAGNIYAGGYVGTNAFASKYSSSGSLNWSVNPFPISTTFPTPRVNSIIPYNNSLLVFDQYIGFKTLSTTDGIVITSDSLVGNTLDGTFWIRDVEATGSGYVSNINGSCGFVILDNLTLTATCGDCNSPCYADVLIVRTSDSPPLAAPPIDNTPGYILASPDLKESDFTFFPNPATGVLNIDLPTSAEVGRVIIQNHLGKIIWSGNAAPDDRSMTINLDHRFSDGVYYISYITATEIVTKPLIVTR